MMRKLILIVLIVIICFQLASISVYSAENKNVGFIFEYKKELGLTDNQEKNLRDMLVKIQSYLADKQKELGGLQAELNKMIAVRVDLAKIKLKINDMAKIQAEVIYENIASNRAVEAELSETQRAKWYSMQEEFAAKFQQAYDAPLEAKEMRK